MSKEKSNNTYEELEKDFSDVDLALDSKPESYAETDLSRTGIIRENFQEEFKAVFSEDPMLEGDKKKVEIISPESISAGIYDWIRCVIFAIAIVVICLTFVFRLVEVDGGSMNDTLFSGDKVIVTNLFYEPHNNDVVVISHGSKYANPIIKRVIAIEGQSVKLDYENERIFVDGIEINEPYIKGTTFSGNWGDNHIPDVIPKGKIFVMGDNRLVSMDSRSTEIGLIDVENVIGKAQVVVFPFNHFGYVYDK